MEGKREPRMEPKSLRIVKFIHKQCKDCKLYKSCEDKFFRCFDNEKIKENLNSKFRCRLFQPKKMP